MRCPACNQEYEEGKMEVDFDYRIIGPRFNSDITFDDELSIWVNGQHFCHQITTIIGDDGGIMSPVAYRRRLEGFGKALQTIGHNIAMQALHGRPMVHDQAGVMF